MDPTRRSIGFYRRRYPTIGSSSHPLQYTLRGEDSGTIEFRGSDRHKVNFTQKPQHCLIKAASGFISHPPTRGFLGYKASKDQTSFTANGDKQDLTLVRTTQGLGKFEGGVGFSRRKGKKAKRKKISLWRERAGD